MARIFQKFYAAIDWLFWPDHYLMFLGKFIINTNGRLRTGVLCASIHVHVIPRDHNVVIDILIVILALYKASKYRSTVLGAGKDLIV